VVQDILPKVII